MIFFKSKEVKCVGQWFWPVLASLHIFHLFCYSPYFLFVFSATLCLFVSLFVVSNGRSTLTKRMIVHFGRLPTSLCLFFVRHQTRPKTVCTLQTICFSLYVCWFAFYRCLFVCFCLDETRSQTVFPSFPQSISLPKSWYFFFVFCLDLIFSVLCWCDKQSD